MDPPVQPTRQVASFDAGWLEAVPDAVFVIDGTGVIRYANARAGSLTGYLPDELIAQPVEVLVPARHREKHVRDRDRFLSSPHRRPMGMELDLMCQRKDGASIPVDVMLAPLEVEGLGTVVVVTVKDLAGVVDVDEAVLRTHVRAGERRGGFLEAVAAAAGALLTAPDWTTSLPDALAHLGRALRVSRVTVYRNEDDGGNGAVAAGVGEWLAEGVGTEIDHPENQRVPWQGAGFEAWAECLSAGEVFQRIAEFAPPAERRLMDVLGVRSELAVPVTLGGTWWGYLGVCDSFDARLWGEGEIDALRLTADLLSAAIARTEREAEAAEREHLFELVVEAEPECVKLCDADGTIQRMNAAGLAMLEADRVEQVVGSNLMDYIVPEHRDLAGQVFAHANEGKPGRLTFEAVGLRGGRRWFESHVVPLPNRDGAFRSILSITRDVTETVTTQEELRASIELLEASDAARHDLLQRVVQAQEEERARLASDIHDGPIQRLTASLLRLGTPTDPSNGGRELEEISEVLRSSIAELRALVFSLYPTSLDQEGLAAGLRELASTMEGTEEGPLITVTDRLVDEPSKELRGLAYRIAQEAMTNAWKHARGSRIEVQLATGGGELHMVISDDGVGMPADAADLPAPGHLGVRSIQERTHVAGGTVRFGTPPGGGTTVDVRLPLRYGRGDG